MLTRKCVSFIAINTVESIKSTHFYYKIYELFLCAEPINEVTIYGEDHTSYIITL